jgi:hypothetical protein
LTRISVPIADETFMRRLSNINVQYRARMLSPFCIFVMVLLLGPFRATPPRSISSKQQVP